MTYPIAGPLYPPSPLPSGSSSIRVQACLPEVVALAPPVLATNVPVVVAVVAAVVVVALVVVIVDVLLAVLLDVVDVDVHVLQVTGHCWRKRTGARVVGSGIQMDEVHSLLDMLLQKRGSSTPKHLCGSLRHSMQVRSGRLGVSAATKSVPAHIAIHSQSGHG